MKRGSKINSAPNWDRLFEIAAGQEGYFTSSQALEAGYYPQLLHKHLKSNRLVRIRRGIYRLVHFPVGDYEDFVVVWLWTQKCGVFSHETALMLHNLSDALPAKVHITLPDSWKNRRFRIPEGVTLHFADIAPKEKTWVGAVPVTDIGRTLKDCADVRVEPDVVHDAFEEATRRNLVTDDVLTRVTSYLKEFFSLPDGHSSNETSRWPE